MTLRDLWHPERFQGAGKHYPYFEGWYFKLVDVTETHRYAVIPGVYIGPTPSASQSFVQFLDGSSGEVTFIRYPLSAFRASREPFYIQVGPNHFSPEHVVLALEGPDLMLSGEVRLLDVNPWPGRWYAPGIMGWFSFVPFMQCYHGIVSLDHRLQGTLTHNGRDVDLTGGRGYAEKDWGSAFPSAWVWFQSNHLNAVGSSLTASVATIPWLGFEFAGFIIALWHQRVLYRFATYTGARLEKLQVQDQAIDWVVADRRHRLQIHVLRDRPGQLYAPDMADMNGRVGETLGARASIALTERASRHGAPRTVFEGEARLGGLEVVGDTTRLSRSARPTHGSCVG